MIHDRVLCNAVPAICISMGNDHDNSALLCSSGSPSNVPVPHIFFLSEATDFCLRLQTFILSF